jgi:hypothetical protein
MGIGLGSLVSIGGGTGGSSGSGGSGIISINSQFGPAILINGVNGIGVTAAGNVITVNAAALSGLITATPPSGLTEINSQTGPAIQVSGINGIDVSQPRPNFLLVDYIPLSGIFDINGLIGPSVTVTGINGIAVYPTGGLLVVDGFSLIPTSGIFLINGEDGPYITIDGVNGASIITGPDRVTIDVSALSGLMQSFTGSGITRINDQQGPEIQISGINGIEVTQPRSNFILLDGAGLSGLIGAGSMSGNACYTTTFTGVIEQTFTHSLGTKAIIVQIQDTNDEFIAADLITAIDIDNVKVRFNDVQSGRLTVLSCGDHGVTPSGVTKFAASFLGITSGMFVHGLQTRDVLVQIYDDSGPPRQLIPDDIVLDTLDAVSLLFNAPMSGRVVIMG